MVDSEYSTDTWSITSGATIKNGETLKYVPDYPRLKRCAKMVFKSYLS